ncbi:unnamed protein product [Clavelina lepadiformis]|uniref:Uncharacterized protein n=1 Tax=Clavelina lepadiformis TaxID=159417 RepID=A0ABP0H482_CLALP
MVMLWNYSGPSTFESGSEWEGVSEVGIGDETLSLKAFNLRFIEIFHRFDVFLQVVAPHPSDSDTALRSFDQQSCMDALCELILNYTIGSYIRIL